MEKGGFEILGKCRECNAEVNASTEMLPDYPGMYECPCCGYPSTKDDLE